MAIHDLGYRSWVGDRTKSWSRPLFIATSGVTLVWRRRWLRLMLMLAWLPIFVPALGIFAFEYSSSEPEMLQVVINLVGGPLQRPDLAVQLMTDREGARHEVWTLLIMAFFRYPQLSAMVLLVGLIAPMLISYDLRSRAYLLYFSRPLNAVHYMVGKAMVVWFFLSMIVTVPALTLYLIGVMLSPDLSVVSLTWDIPVRIVAASVALIVPTTILAMCYSAHTSESRYASFSWFATWILGFVAYQILTYMGTEFGRGRRGGGLDVDFDRWRLLSPYHALGKVEAWIFGLDPTPGSVIPTLLMLVGVTMMGVFLIRRRLLALLSV